jgi:hypothetical protein
MISWFAWFLTNLCILSRDAFLVSSLCFQTGQVARRYATKAAMKTDPGIEFITPPNNKDFNGNGAGN